MVRFSIYLNRRVFVMMIKTVFGIFFYLQVALILPTKFLVSCLSIQEKVQTIFSKCRHLGLPSGIILDISLSIMCPDASFQFSSQLTFRYGDVQNIFSRMRL